MAAVSRNRPMLHFSKNDRFGFDKPRIRSGKLVLFQVDFVNPRNKGIVRCCLGERSLPALNEVHSNPLCAQIGSFHVVET